MESCNYECQRKKNISKLRDLYNKELDSYRQSYNKYMEYKYDTSNDKEWKLTYAENTLRPQVEQSNARLNNILEELKRNIMETEQLIRKQEGEVKLKNSEIYRKNKLLEEQDQKIISNSNELLSKDKQVQFTLERNKYRRWVMMGLITTDIALIAMFYKYYMASQ